MHTLTKAQNTESPRYRYTVLAMLLLVYTFNFIDRQIVGILAQPIKSELGLSDTQLGLMGGLAFALFYTGLGIPIGALADRRNRSWIITIALALWSGFTALSGLATSFMHLFLARLGVGVGEAGGVAPSYSLISDYFPPAQRARAFAVYNFGIPIGSATGILLGGWIATHINWRAAFITVGLCGLLIAPLFRLLVREPARGRYDEAQPLASSAGFGATVRALTSKPSFWLLAAGTGFSSLVAYGLLFWLPSLFTRSYGLSLAETSLYVGTIVLIGGLIGVWTGGWTADRLGTRDRGVYARVPAIAFLVTAPAYAAGVLTPDLAMAFPLFLFPQILAMMWLGPVITAIQHLVAPSARTTAGACFLFVNNLIGLGLGTLFFGFLSDQLAPRFGEDSLRWSILIGLGFYLLASLLMWLASRRLHRDWQD